MAAPKSVKTSPRSCRIVGVITTSLDLRLALRMAHPPDLFELRLDYLVGIEKEMKNKVSRLRVPVIITARHPAEGGANNLSLKRRSELLWRFLPHARYIDLELRSVPGFRSLLEATRRQNVGRIISLHHLNSTPTSRNLHARARAAKSHGADFFKIATRTDTPAQLARLLDFVSHEDASLPLIAMGIGKLGGISRIALARAGSVLAYASLGEKRVEGQLSVEQLRAAFDIFEIGPGRSPRVCHVERSRDISYHLRPKREDERKQ
jgi:3-dehydroquinate dehydratase I